MKGRNTVVVSIRITDKVYQDIALRASTMSVGDYVRELVYQSLYSVNKGINAPDLDADGRTVPDYW